MRKRWLPPLFVSLLILAAPVAAHADVNDFTITSFSADYALSKSDPQGALDIDENLSVDFTDYNHGILRALPKRYNGQDLHLAIRSVARDGQTEPYTTYSSNGNEVLKIGNANLTITGRHTYDIRYSVQNVIRFTKDHDELDWNTNGTEWSQPFDHIRATLALATTSKGKGSLNLQQVTNSRCVTGAQGSTAGDCTVEPKGNGYTYETTRPLSPGENMTFVADFPLGTFQKPTAADWWRDHIGTIAAIVLPALISLLIGYRKWHRDGKDIKGRGTIIPEYSPPDGIRAAEAEAIMRYHPTNKAVAATIIDLAIRKHLKIVESTSNGVLGIGKHKEYSFEKLESDTSDLSDYEQTLYTGLFTKGSSVTTKQLKNSYYTSVDAAKAQISARLTADGYVPKGQFLKGWWLWLLAVLEGALAFIVHSVASLGFVLGAIIFVVFALLMSKRTPKGVEAKDNLEGLKMYMETAEKDRIAMLQSPDSPYVEKSDAPKQTVELFEKLLPYAIVLGVENQWAKQFESIYTTPPDWYAGNWTAFNTGYLVGSLNDSIGAMNSSFASPSSSGSGGGGGFSGGGGGGGGGGGW